MACTERTLSDCFSSLLLNQVNRQILPLVCPFGENLPRTHRTHQLQVAEALKCTRLVCTDIKSITIKVFSIFARIVDNPSLLVSKVATAYEGFDQ